MSKVSHDLSCKNVLISHNTCKTVICKFVQSLYIKLIQHTFQCLLSYKSNCVSTVGQLQSLQELEHILKEKCNAHFQVHNLICLKAEKTNLISHTVQWCSTVFPLCFSSHIFKVPPPKTQSALIGQLTQA